MKMTDNSLYQGQLYSFQDFRFVDGTSIPKILPILSLYKETDLNSNNQKFYVKANAMNLFRPNDTKVQRLATEVTAKQFLNTKNGHLIDVAASLRMDGYFVDKLPNPLLPIKDRFQDFSGTVGRFAPKIVANWSYPWLASFDTASLIIEPLAQLALSPHGGNDGRKIPNEDSGQVELYDNNLFSDNKFYGYDRVEEGLRGAFGLKTSLFFDNNMGITTLFGQAYNKHRQKEFTEVSGLRNGTSDYVGRTTFTLNNATSFNYRFRLNHDNFSRQRDDINVEYNHAPISGSIGFGSFNNKSDFLTFNRNTRVEQAIGTHRIIYTNGGLVLTKKLSMNGGFTKILTSKNVRNDKRFIGADGSLQYTGECVDWKLFIKREFTRNGDIRPDTMQGFELSLKTLN
jgi:LPS-assembly protein